MLRTITLLILSNGYSLNSGLKILNFDNCGATGLCLPQWNRRDYLSSHKSPLICHQNKGTHPNP